MHSGLPRAEQRGDLLDALERTGFDCLVIGGGITGAGIARLAALQGMSVALVEARDFASGTSGASTKLIHGGLRYLAMGEFGLVRKALLEREQIRRLAPHLAEPRYLYMPADSLGRLGLYWAGVSLYERLGRVPRELWHHRVTAAQMRHRFPHFDVQAFPWALAYCEYFTDDARLVVANLRGAVAEGAWVANHLPVLQLAASPAGRVEGAVVRCALSGRELRIRARVVVNAAGPWVEQVMGLGAGSGALQLSLSKGVHLSVPRVRLPVSSPMFLTTEDGRPLFVIPRDDIVYFGTTDTAWQGAPDWSPGVSEADVAYLLRNLGRYFPSDAIGPGDCLTAWAGLRPLIAAPGAGDTRSLSRRDEVLRGGNGLISIAGGKLTGYRQMAAEAVAAVAGALGGALRPAADPVLPGWDGRPALEAQTDLLREFNIDAAAASRLWHLYGADAAEVLRRGVARVPGAGVLHGGELRWAAEMEGACSAEDAVQRRARLGVYQALPTAMGWQRVRGILAL